MPTPEPISAKIITADHVYEALDKIEPKKRTEALKGLKPKERDTLKKTLQFLQGKTIEWPTQEELKSLHGRLVTPSEGEPLKRIKHKLQNILGGTTSQQILREFDKADKKRRAESALKLGLKALGVKDPTKQTRNMARGSFQKAAQLGNMRAHYHLAMMDREDIEPESALQHLQVGAKAGDSRCQFALAKHFVEKGKFEEAKKWLLKVKDSEYAKLYKKEIQQEILNLGKIFEESKEGYGSALEMYTAVNDEIAIETMQEKRRRFETGLLPKAKVPNKPSLKEKIEQAPIKQAEKAAKKARKEAPPLNPIEMADVAFKIAAEQIDECKRLHPDAKIANYLVYKRDNKKEIVRDQFCVDMVYVDKGIKVTEELTIQLPFEMPKQRVKDVALLFVRMLQDKGKLL